MPISDCDVVADAWGKDGSTGEFLLRMYEKFHIAHHNGIGGVRKSILCLFEMDLWAYQKLSSILQKLSSILVKIGFLNRMRWYHDRYPTPN